MGNLVWMQTDISQLDVTPKLRVPYEGPYMIWRKVGPLDYELYISRDKKKIVHHNRLKPYLGLCRPPGFYKVLKAAKDRQEKARQERARQERARQEDGQERDRQNGRGEQEAGQAVSQDRQDKQSSS